MKSTCISYPTSPHGRRLFELLGDGLWHPLNELVAEAGAWVPPGIAFRTANYRRLGHRTARPLTEEQQVQVGRRMVVHGLLESHHKRGRLAKRVLAQGRGTAYRAPRCPRCGGPVLDDG